MTVQPHALEQIENHDGTAILQAPQTHTGHMDSNNMVSSSSAINIQPGYLETSSTHMTMSHTGTVFPQHTFILPQTTAGGGSGFIPRASSAAQHTAQTVTANIQPVMSPQYITGPIQMPIQIDMGQHQQQQHQQSPQLLRISTLPQQT